MKAFYKANPENTLSANKSPPHGARSNNVNGSRIGKKAYVHLFLLERLLGASHQLESRLLRVLPKYCITSNSKSLTESHMKVRGGRRYSSEQSGTSHFLKFRCIYCQAYLAAF